MQEVVIELGQIIKIKQEVTIICYSNNSTNSIKIGIAAPKNIPIMRIELLRKKLFGTKA